MGYGDLGCTGSKELYTPAIDRLEKEGVFCSGAYVTAPMCAPSRMGMMTGRFPKRYGITNNPNKKMDYLTEVHYGLPLTETLIPEYLTPYGYRCGMFGKWHLGHTKGFTPPERGFTHWWGFLGGSRDYFATKKETKGLNTSAIETNYAVDTKLTYLTDDITDRAIDFIRESGREQKPFFMFVSYTAPHWPLQAKEQDIEKFNHIGNKNRRIYCAMVYAMDRGIDRILKTLKECGMDENTLVVFLSDNGGAPEAPSCNAPFRGAKRQHYEGGVRVPMIVRYPKDKGLRAGAICHQTVSTLDLLPAILKLNGAVIPKKLDGMDLLELLKRKEPYIPRTFYWVTDYTAAILEGNMKYVLVPDRAPGLFDLATDAQESRNLYFSNTRAAEALSKKLGRYLTTTPPGRYPESEAWSAKLLKEYDESATDVQPK